MWDVYTILKYNSVVPRNYFYEHKCLKKRIIYCKKYFEFRYLKNKKFIGLNAVTPIWLFPIHIHKKLIKTM